MKKQKKPRTRGSVIGFALGAALGLAFCAGSLGRFGDWLLELPLGAYLACLLGGFAVCFVPATLIQTVVHEGGHLVCGLASGYGFRSFRVGGLLWSRQNGRLKLSRLQVPGTAGQCLLAPPAPAADGSYPYRLYLAGGVLANLLTGLLCLWPALTVQNYWLAMFWLGLAVLGLGMAVQNGLPVHMARVCTDGYNFYRMAKNADARRAVWLQLAYVAALADGCRMSELPEEWFAPGAWVLHPSAQTQAAPRPGEALAVFCGLLQIARLQEQGRWVEADAAARTLLAAPAGPDGLLELQRDCLELDLAYSALVGSDRAAWLESLGRAGRAELKAKAQKSAGLPAGQRVLYAWYTLAEPQPRQAAAWRKRFETTLARYPYPAEAACERALFARAQVSAGAAAQPRA